MASWSPSPLEMARRATPSQGSAKSGSNPNSLSGMLSTAIPAGLLAIFLLSLFLLLRTRVMRIYQPRTYLGVLAEHQKTPRPNQSMFGWIKDFSSINDNYILNHHSLDAYLWLRFWRTLIFICALGWPLTWIILMPVYGTAHAGEKQFDKLSYSNISSSTDGNRLYAVVFVAWIFLGGIMWLIGRECVHSVQLKQAFLLLPGIQSRMASRTVLFTNVPDEYQNEEKLRATFPNVRHVWISTDTKELDDLVEDRDKTAMKLEGAEVKLGKSANDARRKAEKKGNKQPIEDPLGWVDEKSRPTHRLKPLIGKKVDTIDWCRTHLGEQIPKVEAEQEKHWNGKAEANGGVFIEFDNVQTAEAAYHETTIDLPKGFEARAVGTRPDEIIWKNLNMKKSLRKGLTILVSVLIALMILFWGPITAFVGALSNINSLTNEVPFLSFINSIPPVILGVVTGLLPVVILAVILALVPIIMRVLFKLAGAVSLAEVELKTQTWYFVFQFIQAFLITTLSSGASAATTQIIMMPSTAPTLLASNLPKASNFYINYFVLFGLATAASTLFNVVAVLLYIVLGHFLDKTPRKMYNRYTNLASLKWGSLYPKFINLGVIAISYSCIAPLILGFATLSFFFLYIAFRYHVVYSVDTMIINTQGRAFSKAMQQLTTGVYTAAICLIGLFAISTSSNVSATGPLVLMIIFLIFIIIYHILLNRTISSIAKNTSRDQSHAATTQSREEQMMEGGIAGKGDGTAAVARLPTRSEPKPFSMLVKLLRPPQIPHFEAYLDTPIPPYSEDVRKEAYLPPNITSPTPLLWIVHDDMGLSTREKADSGKVVGVSDSGAWWDERTGKLTTIWTGQDDKEVQGANLTRNAPIYEEHVFY